MWAGWIMLQNPFIQLNFWPASKPNIETHIELKTLRKLLPMCSRCKKIRDDKGFWNDVDSYLETHSHLTFTHGICPECMDRLYKGYDWYKKRKPSDTDE